MNAWAKKNYPGDKMNEDVQKNVEAIKAFFNRTGAQPCCPCTSVHEHAESVENVDKPENLQKESLRKKLGLWAKSVGTLENPSKTSGLLKKKAREELVAQGIKDGTMGTFILQTISRLKLSF